MTEIATINWFGRYRTSVFSENTAIFVFFKSYIKGEKTGTPANSQMKKTYE